MAAGFLSEQRFPESATSEAGVSLSTTSQASPVAIVAMFIPIASFGVVGKAQEDRVADDVGLDVEQLAVARRGLGSLPEHLEIGLNPLDGLGGLGDAGHAKDRARVMPFS